MTSTEAIKTYHEAGYTVTAIAPGKKVPWQGTKPSAIRARPQTRDDIERLFSGRPGANVAILTGACSRDLAVVDCDDRTGWEVLDRYPVIRRLKAVSAVVQTRRGYHLYARLPFPARSATLGRFHADFKAEGALVVAPPSIVRREHGISQLYLWDHGFRPAYVPTEAETADLVALLGIESALEARPGCENDQADESSGVFYGLGEAAWTALRRPDPNGDRSAAEQAAIYRAAVIGFSLSDVKALFSLHAAPGTKYSEKLRDGYADQWLSSSFSSAVGHAAQSMTPYMAAINSALQALETQNPFRGRARGTDSAVYASILQIVRETGREWITAPTRTIADRAGVDGKRVSDAYNRLSEAGALVVQRSISGVVVRPDTQFMSGELCPNRHTLTHSLTSPVSAVPAQLGARPVVHDAYRFCALGSVGPAIVRAINARKGESFTVRDLSRLGISHQTILKKLDLLRRASLVETCGLRSTDGAGRPATLYRAFSRIGFSELDHIAQVAGTVGAGERQRARHAEARDSYKRRRLMS